MLHRKLTEEVVVGSLYVTIGLPGSGKSTWAAQKAQKETQCLIVNRDSFRSMIKGGKYVFDKDYEEYIKTNCYDFINMLLAGGFDVIVDETNLTVQKRHELFNNAMMFFGEKKHTFIGIYFDKSKDVCLENRMKDSRGYDRKKWNEVIQSMVESLEEPKPQEFDEFKTIQ